MEINSAVKIQDILNLLTIEFISVYCCVPSPPDSAPWRDIKAILQLPPQHQLNMLEPSVYSMVLL